MIATLKKQYRMRITRTASIIFYYNKAGVTFTARKESKIHLLRMKVFIQKLMIFAPGPSLTVDKKFGEFINNVMWLCSESML